MQDGCICKMENIMKSVAISVSDVVGQGITYEYAIPLEISFAATALIDSDLELSRELLFYSKLAIEIKANQVNRLWLQECTPSFPDVPPRYVRERQLCGMDCIEIGSREGDHVIARRPTSQQSCGRLPQAYQGNVQRRRGRHRHGDVSECTFGYVACCPYV